ncbi:ANTAR domain-containing protein [Modestobacter sp. I12A-02662]|uniref:ANTAR domain-containing protein n=1 Tax=Modestobacter sp. I12A-02662 TaxID=1730496 RepID=UPI0034DEEE57
MAADQHADVRSIRPGSRDEHAAGTPAPGPDADRLLEDADEPGERFRAALRDRDVISTAKGVLMARHGVDEETALHLLLETSRASGTRLREVASDVVSAAVRQRS